MSIPWNWSHETRAVSTAGYNKRFVYFPGRISYLNICLIKFQRLWQSNLRIVLRNHLTAYALHGTLINFGRLWSLMNYGRVWRVLTHSRESFTGLTPQVVFRTESPKRYSIVYHEMGKMLLWFLNITFSIKYSYWQFKLVYYTWNVLSISILFSRRKRLT